MIYRLMAAWTIPLVIGAIIGIVSARSGQPVGVIVAVVITMPAVFLWRVFAIDPITIKRKHDTSNYDKLKADFERMEQRFEQYRDTIR